MKVLHLPTPVGGNSWGLSQGERALDLNSKVLYLTSNWLDYPSDINLRLERKNKFTSLLKRVQVFYQIRKKFDVFHFNFGQTLLHSPNNYLNQFDLPFYPKSAKLYVTYNGCDARQKISTMRRTAISACHNPECYEGICNSGKAEKLKKRSIAKMAAHVRHIWAVNPDLLHFLPRNKSSFLPYSVISATKEPVWPNFTKKRLNIIHAPTSRAAKGSEYIITALRQIQKTHADFVNIQLVEGVSHNNAIQIYKQADLVIDQILIGWYGGFAIEVMSMGKPVICRIEKNDLHFIPKRMAKDIKDTFINADPKNVKDVILNCIHDRKFLQKKSEAAIEYARTWHDPKYVATITKEAYENL